MYKKLTDKEIKVLLIKLRNPLTIIEAGLPEGKVPWDYDEPLSPKNMSIEKKWALIHQQNDAIYQLRLEWKYAKKRHLDTTDIFYNRVYRKNL